MKKNLTFIALVATTIFCSCGSSETKENAETVETAQVQQEKPKVKIAKVTAEEVAQLEQYTTTVEAEVKNNIIPSSALRIEKILVEVGDNVRKGQKLVLLDASSLDQLKMQVENQEIDFKRVEELYKVGGASAAEYDNAKTQLEVNKRALANKLENTVLVSPIDGVVSARNYDNGDMYGGKPILVVEQISPVKMKINVSESRYAQTNKSLPVTVTFDTYGSQEFTGKIDIVYPTINAATHTFPVEIKIANNDRKVRPGMFGHVTVNFGTKNHVVVPDQAVIKQAGAGDYYVYTYEQNGTVKHNKVELGRRMGDRYELISGIEPNSYVVVAGQTNLSNGKEVEVME
ncbi:MAG: efflux RND transporter periplasmic adaptor subunit [Bacteroidaceae bacterium]|nr:efflux RND transporter periplasmic adaptor subunit [Bacteroidaceae bacterium]